jgi:hypothetical protein
LLDDDIVTVPAGWYPDPMGLPQLRWWDNYAWTEFTSAARTPLIVQDEPKLAYADDDLPSRRSQREQRQQGGDRRQTGNPADLASTLRQLEPPKPQNIERSQPAPDFETQATAEPSAEQQRFEQQRQEQLLREQQEQNYREQQYRAPEPEADPFAEFLAEPADPRDNSQGSTTRTGFPEQAPFGTQGGFDQPGFDQPLYDQPASGAFSQPQPAAQFAQQAGQFGADRDASGQYGYGQNRMGVHTPLAYTPFVWIIAMIPLIQLVGILLVVSAVDVTVALPFLLAIAVGPYIAGIPLAVADHRQLKRTGHQRPAHWAWSVLTAPAYLVARAIAASREHGKGLTPLLVWASLSLLQVASIIAVPGILISAMPAVFSTEVEESIEADSAIAGRELAVDCPATPPVQIGGTFNCTGVLASTGEEVGIVVRLQRANGWIDWRVYGMVWENASQAATTPTTDGTTTDGTTTDDAPTEIVEGEVVQG